MSLSHTTQALLVKLKAHSNERQSIAIGLWLL